MKLTTHIYIMLKVKNLWNLLCPVSYITGRAPFPLYCYHYCICLVISLLDTNCYSNNINYWLIWAAVHHILLMRTHWRSTPISHTSRRLRYSSKLYMAFWWINWAIVCLVFLCTTNLCMAGAMGFSLLQSIQKTFGVHSSSSSRGTRVPSPRIKCSGHEANHLPPSDAKIRNEWSYTPSPQYDCPQGHLYLY